ncbi:hypothetical protein GRI89_00380 [Altererythrobacter salegens]|uniref:Uncharacterized protein n=1 Tax=Croceibacterium salegens TaxID=1737568 RepID=A0A6I4SQ01_9SPHN|nr:hypothetical protein [Croceibacterium salegens]MXO58001.1 hypothetical protein [Croceibacterium salegens]
MTRHALLLAGIAALTAVPANASVSDFRLPTGPTPTPTSRAEGPLDPDLPLPVQRPSPTPTPAPRPTPTIRPAPTTGATSAPVIQQLPAQPSPTPTPQATPSRAAQLGRAPTPVTPSATPSPTPSPTTESGVEARPVPAFTPTTSATPAPAPVEADETGDGLPWGWIGALAALLVLGGGIALWLRRPRGPRGTVLIVPEIEKPRVPAKPAEPATGDLPEPTFAAPVQPQPIAEPEPAGNAAEHPLHILIQPVKLTQTVMNMTLAYRLELTNRGTAPFTNLAVSGDLVGAHASLPREELLAGPDTVLPEKHRVAALAPGETIELKGDLRVALASVVPIRQGAAVIFVPLARFRASSDGEAPRCFTVAVGEPAASGAIQPFRLDLGLRSVEGLGGRAF